MGLRFRHRIKIAPGIHLNVSLSGVTTSLGGPGATLNVGGMHGARGTVGLPGSGMSYSEVIPCSLPHQLPHFRGRVWSAIGMVLVVAVLLSWLFTSV